jgi:hypothetical protein
MRQPSLGASVEHHRRFTVPGTAGSGPRTKEKFQKRNAASILSEALQTFETIDANQISLSEPILTF